VVDSTGEKRTMQTYAYSKVPRKAEKLEAEMTRLGKIRKGRIGNSRMLLVTAADVVTCMTDMVNRGNYPYDLTATAIGVEGSGSAPNHGGAPRLPL